MLRDFSQTKVGERRNGVNKVGSGSSFLSLKVSPKSSSSVEVRQDRNKTLKERESPSIGWAPVALFTLGELAALMKAKAHDLYKDVQQCYIRLCNLFLGCGGHRINE